MCSLFGDGMEEDAPLVQESTATTSRPSLRSRSLVLVTLCVGSAALAGVLALSHARSSAAPAVADAVVVLDALARADASVPTLPPTMPCVKDKECAPRSSSPAPTMYRAPPPYPTPMPTTRRRFSDDFAGGTSFPIDHWKHRTLAPSAVVGQPHNRASTFAPALEQAREQARD